MNVTDLRIGNWVCVNAKDIKGNDSKIHIHLQPVDFIRLIMGNNSADPIPLTEEWLLKFGLERDKGVVMERCRISLTLFDLEFHTGKIWIRTSTSVIQIDHIKYVHQLQNLYFALTGEELTIKELSK